MLEALLLLLGGLLLIALALFYGAFAWGFVMYKFWGWFVLPVFPLLPTLTIVQCVGLMCFIGLFHSNVPQIIKKEYKDESQHTWITVLAPPVSLFIGWLIYVCIVR
jgi:hypothetical protein